MTSEIGSQDDEQPPGGSYLSLRAEGNLCYLKGKYYEAIDFFTRALEVPSSGHSDSDVFIRRGWCHLQLANTKDAFQDVIEAQADIVNCPEAAGRLILLRAEVLYATGEFEKALVHFNRGKDIKPKAHEFVQGINKCREAISNCVGGPERIKLTLNGDLSPFDHNVEARSLNHQMMQLHLHDASTINDMKPVANERTIKQLLAELYDDKLFLEKLYAESGRKMQYDNTSIAALDETLRYLNRRTTFWQKQNPIYSRSHDKSMREKRRPCTVSSCKYLDQFLSKELEKVQMDINNANLGPGLRRASRCLNMIKNMDRSMPINRDAFNADVHGLIGKIYFEANQLRRAQKHCIISKDMAIKSGVKSCQKRAFENLANVYIRQHDYHNAVQQWTPKLDLLDNAEERAWLCHDIGRCYMEMEQYTQALEYGAKALMEMAGATDKHILLSIKVLIAQAHAKLADYVAARETYGIALSLAQYLGSKSTETLIQEALEKVSECVEPGTKFVEDSSYNGMTIVVSKSSKILLES